MDFLLYSKLLHKLCNEYTTNWKLYNKISVIAYLNMWLRGVVVRYGTSDSEVAGSSLTRTAVE